MGRFRTTYLKIALSFLALLILLLTIFSGWVVMAPEFRNSLQQTVVGRWKSAVTARAVQVGDIFRPSRPKAPSAAKKSIAEEPPKVVGPASVLVLDNRNRPIPDVAVTFRPVPGGGVVTQKTNSQGRMARSAGSPSA
jgi:hypothetical protein